ncbi:TfuA-like protein [Kitasatospora sp. NPDC058170]|uniref:TfuA-like protein n=1 Tax=Kitasatospora sp. NPDC058170 TaxID=3346364 RepID=UPI0036DA195C
MTTYVFVGPTLPAARVAALAPGSVVRPPVAHGDLFRLGLGPGDTAIVVDGHHDHATAVRHREVLAALAAGVRVVGCAGLGALWAAELRPFGMIGHGEVFRMYRDGVIHADDEVAVAHGDGPDYRRTSEPLVNIRHTLGAAVAADVLTAPQAAALLDAARALPYHRRSWRAVERTCGGADLRGLREFLTARPEHADRKAADASDTLARLTLLDRMVPPAPPVAADRATAHRATPAPAPTPTRRTPSES